MNTDFHTESYQKQCLISALISFNLTLTLNISTRIQCGSSTTIYNIFIDGTRKDHHYAVKLVINGLYDCDAYLIVIKPFASNYSCVKQIMQIEYFAVNGFINHQRNENRISVYNSHDIDLKFNTVVRC
jgi:hypothetical protein